MTLYEMIQRDQERFWSNVDIANENGCRNWLLSCDPDGYGQFHIYDSINRKKLNPRAHQVAYILTHGEIPEGLLVCHTRNCVGNRRCCEPTHLYAGTYKDNADDRQEQGRGFFKVGEDHPFVSLTDDIVREIKLRLRDDSNVYGLVNRLAREYNVTKMVISSIKVGRTWKHITV